MPACFRGMGMPENTAPIVIRSTFTELLDVHITSVVVITLASENAHIRFFISNPGVLNTAFANFHPMRKLPQEGAESIVHIIGDDKGQYDDHVQWGFEESVMRPVPCDGNIIGNIVLSGLELLSNGALTSGLHRVVRAPAAQAPHDRYSVLIC
ncbi:uncharacterized protein F4812DRAFT_454942 [Daldinia caldariorum]|uniref:uncharacterized protein n=1 Tax=Daldinia caldariorum TaxID=326644 RepID=UPI002007DD80|nr:uncharacterized protein F4812DRAFT_454942 [Daldinia caldariorum]KAI1473125.1 hypothetical protein F4812DRAFT_454942 [Daldinia caldariorum]